MGIVAKYKFDGSVYADLIPEFNAEFTNYTVTDEIEGNIITRTIESDSLPTLMRFGTTHEGVGGEEKSSLREIIKLDTSNLTSMYCMFRDCAYVTSINTDGWNTSKITDMTSIFNGCGRLTSLDLSNLDTSSAIYFKKMFIGCVALTSIDTSIWKTNKVIDTLDMFRDCTKLKLLDISNYDLTNVTLSSEMFTGTENLTDIGMIYCNKETVNKVASLLPTDHNITIWVESDDILQYDQYDHITYKTQKVEDTVHLNSPLLMGDTIEVIDGKTYHVHRWGKVVLDGSEDWINSDANQIKLYKTMVKDSLAYCDKMPYYSWSASPWKLTVPGISFAGDAIYIYNCDKQWLQANPTTLIYQRATPYYELISEEPLELTLLDTADNTINNNSILPSNMTIANKELSTIAIKSSTTYTLSFDKSNVDSEVTIDICGGEQITTVLNKVELTTPSELGSGIRFISSDGCIVSNVRLLEGSLVKEAIPKETFEGLKSSFDDGYIIGENLITTNVSETGGQTLRRDFSKRIYKNATVIIPSEYVGKLRMAMCRDNLGWVNNYPITTTIQHFSCNTDEFYNCVSIAKADITLEELANLDIIVLEGDHTHLSEAELMRYIEKGTSHYEEEDYNHVGKYKVQYKVTGKNKFDGKLVHGDIATGYLNNSMIHVSSANYIKIKPNTIYTLSATDPLYNEGLGLVISYYDSNKEYILHHNATAYEVQSPPNAAYCRIRTRKSTDDNISLEEITSIQLQLEEGTVATEYEPYKEDIKTYYLSSPLLEGDTIEDINGVATHIKRYEKVVLDGSSDEYWSENTYWSTDTIKQFYTLRFPRKPQTKVLSDKFTYASNTIYAGYDCIGSSDDTAAIYIAISSLKLSTSDVNGFTQYLQQNPTTVIYELASPIYEPISTESILLDSYTNGHLDLSNENIPIQKTEFRNFTKELAYLQPSTDYVVRFSSDNIGIAKVYLDSSVKEINIVQGINEVIITTPSTIVNNNIIIDGIGFNISNVQVVADAIKDGDIKDFDYFKGLQSSFEDGLVTDENDENYGKYKVECKIVGKNKWHLGDLYFDAKTIRSDGVTPLFKKGVYTLSCDTSIWGATIRFIDNSGKEINWIPFESITFTLKEDIYTIHLYSKDWSSSLSQGNFVTIDNIQLEEGIQATPYEPYKESIHTLYLNSPLLKGDKLVVHDGKLCHYHKMGMVVLDGSEKWTDLTYTGRNVFCYETSRGCPSDFRDGGILYSDTKPRGSERPWIGEIGLAFCRASQHGLYAGFATADEGCAWVKNPTTVVYELAEPYYEPIEPQSSQYSFSAVKDGDMEIITTLPIEKINLTYRTDINGVSSIEEQIASIQESTDISSIIDEEVDE